MRTGRVARLWAAATVAAGLVVTSTATAEARSAYRDSEVVQLTAAGDVRGAGGLALHMTALDAVGASNLALATTSCDDCHATAISFQVVVADKAPTTVGIANAAFANNEGCSRCEAQAYAYQFVLAFVGNAKLSSEGYRRLRAIDDQLRALARSGLPSDQLHKGAEAYASQVMAVLGSELRVRPQVRRSFDAKGAPA